MIRRLLELLGEDPAGSAVPEDQRIALATCVLLLELAHADGEFDERERRVLSALLEERFELDAEARGELIDLAHQERHASVDLYAFTRELNDTFTPEQKVELVKEMWRVVYADDALHHHEEYLIRRLSDLLRIPHRKMIAAKLEIQNTRADHTP